MSWRFKTTKLLLKSAMWHLAPDSSFSSTIPKLTSLLLLSILRHRTKIMTWSFPSQLRRFHGRTPWINICIHLISLMQDSKGPPGGMSGRNGMLLYPSSTSILIKVITRIGGSVNWVQNWVGEVHTLRSQAKVFGNWIGQILWKQTELFIKKNQSQTLFQFFE